MPSLEPPTSVVLLAQAFSLGGGASTTFRGGLSCLGGEGSITGEEGSSSRPLSAERSLSLRLEALPDWPRLPGWEDSLPVRERPAGWSSLRQLGCLSLGLRSGILSSSCRCSFSCSLFSLSSTSLSLAAVSTGLAPPKMEAALSEGADGALLCSTSLGRLRGFRINLGLSTAPRSQRLSSRLSYRSPPRSP